MAPKKKLSSPLPEQHARVLAQRLFDDQLVLVAGAGLSHLAPAKDESDRRLPLWSALGRQVGEICGEDPAAYDNDVLDLFDGVVYGQSRGVLEKAVQQALPDEDFELSTTHRALGSLDWSAIVTTNYDGLLARLLGQTPVVHEHDYDRLSRPAEDKPRLFQIHGSLDHPHTLTRDDYDLWEDKHPRAYAHLKQLLLEKTVLVVGYSLSDPHLTALLATIRKITAGREKRLYGWFWEIEEPKVKLLDRRDKIEAVRIDQEEQWAAASEQVASELEKLQAQKATLEANTVTGPPKPTNSEDRYAREQYSRAVEAHYGSAILRGFQLSGTGFAQEQVPLLDVFVEPDLVRHRSENPAEMMENLGGDESQFVVPLEGLSQAARERQRRLREAADGTRESALQLLDQESQVLVVGDPGQGKSTLLRRYLLAAVERWLGAPGEAPIPIYLRLAEWTGIEGPAEGRLAQAARERLPRLGEVPSDAVERWLDGPVLWLLDGIDEVRDPAERGKLQGEIAARSRLYPEDQWVVSTRPAGEPSGGLGGFERTELPHLTDEQVEAVLEKWATLKARSGEHPYKPAELAESLQSSIALSEVAHNALFLTLIVLFYIRQRRLPHDRWEFYQEAVTLLSDSWARNRTDGGGDEIPGRYLGTLLEQLAFEGMIREQVIWTRAELAAAVERILRPKNYSGEALDREVERFLAAAEDLIGILVEQGPDRFGFLHLTFQEYFAARALDNRSGEAREVIARFWDHPDWGEVWAFYALGIQKDSARLEELFLTIRQNRDTLDDELLYRDRFACLRLMGVVHEDLPATARSVIDWAWSWIEEKETRHELRYQFFGILSRWERLIPPEDLFALLEYGSAELRAGAARACRGAASEVPVREALIQQLDDDESSVRYEVVESLRGVAAEATVRGALLGLLTDEDSIVRYLAVKALAPVAYDPPVREALLEALLVDVHVTVRLGAIEFATRVTAEAFIQRVPFEFIAENDPIVRFRLAELLARMADETAIQGMLLERLADDKPSVRTIAARSLALVAAKPIVCDALLGTLTDKEASVRSVVVASLAGLMGIASVREAILERVTDDVPSVRASAVDALARLSAEAVVQEALLKRLTDDDPDVRFNAVESLAEVAAVARVQEALLERLEDDDEYIRAKAVESLARLVNNTTVREALLERLADDESHVRSQAVISLSRMVAEHSVREALLERLADDHEDVRSHAVAALSRVAGEATIREALLERLSDDKSSVRSSAAFSLSPMATVSAVRDALLNLLADSEEHIRYSALKSLARVTYDPIVCAALIQSLKTEPTSRVRREIRQILAPVIAKERRAALGPLPTPLF